jgi:dTDP-4-dehydrorhamnose 3,5-epimerase
MQFERTRLADVRLVHLQPHRDQRGSFVRTWCREAFASEGLEFSVVQANQSVTCARGVIRGMHFQHPPNADAKIVRVTRGQVYDVVVDLRSDSSSRGGKFAVTLSDDTDTMLYVPAGFAHGFQTLSSEVVVEYLHDQSYSPDSYDGFRFDDSSAGIEWPLPPTLVSDRDRSWPPLVDRMPWIRNSESGVS